MTVKTLQSWSDFVDFVDRIRRDTGTVGADGDVLFRGQADSRWPIATTLERRSSREYSVVDYAQLALDHVHKLRSETGMAWATLTDHDLLQWPSTIESHLDVKIPCYPYMVYLRQHGFASPLLDWTESPFIAAYFAFHEPSPQDGYASIYMYRETPNNDTAKVMSPNYAMISVRGPYVATHPRRHFTQQAWYTVCGKWDDTKTSYGSPRGHVICPHCQVFNRGHEDQDVLINVEIPRSERRTVLGFLKDVNINHFTLFRTEDALVRAADIDAFDLSQ